MWISHQKWLQQKKHLKSKSGDFKHIEKGSIYRSKSTRVTRGQGEWLENETCWQWLHDSRSSDFAIEFNWAEPVNCTQRAFTFESTWLHLWTVISCNIHFRPVNWNEIIETNWKGYKRQHNILQADGWKIHCQTTISNVIRLQNCRFLSFDNNLSACY